MTYAAKVDANQPQIVRALRDAGATVQPLQQVKKGCPDILVGFRGQNYLMEVKNVGGKMNSEELDWHIKWRGQVAVVYSVAGALRVLGIVEA